MPAPLIVLEEPENGLDWVHRNKFLETLNDFEKTRNLDNSQVFINSHHPAIANSLHPSQVWIFETDREGFTAVERASDSILFESGADLDNPQWFSMLFDDQR